MNKQPFYHDLAIIFTATEDLSDLPEGFETRLAAFLKKELGEQVIGHSVTVDYIHADPGDPADLVE